MITQFVMSKNTNEGSLGGSWFFATEKMQVLEYEKGEFPDSRENSEQKNHENI